MQNGYAVIDLGTVHSMEVKDIYLAKFVALVVQVLPISMCYFILISNLKKFCTSSIDFSSNAISFGISSSHKGIDQFEGMD